MVNLPSVTVYERIACIYINKTFRSLLHDCLLWLMWLGTFIVFKWSDYSTITEIKDDWLLNNNMPCAETCAS